MTASNGFVADGYRRAYSAVEPPVRVEVTAEYAERLERASFWERQRLKREIEREIRRRVHEKAPPDALY
jgi:hypothetical protein